MKSWEAGLNSEQLNEDFSKKQEKEGEMETEKGEEMSEIEFLKPSLLKEADIFEKFRGKAKEIAGVLMFITSLSFAPGLAKEAYGEQKKDNPKIGELEKEKSQEEKAIEFFDKLCNLKDHPEALNPAHAKALKGEEARMLIYLYAAERKGIVSGRISPKDIYDALEELNGASGLYADKFLGNKDGKIDVDEMQKLTEMIGRNEGIKTLLQMIKEFSYIK